MLQTEIGLGLHHSSQSGLVIDKKPTALGRLRPMPRPTPHHMLIGLDRLVGLHRQHNMLARYMPSQSAVHRESSYFIISSVL